MSVDETVKGIHFRQGSKITHASVEMLPEGKDIERIVISSIEFKEKEDVGGRSENNVWIAHFASNPYTKLPMVLNSTNRKRIAKLFPECKGYINQLRDIPVRLTKEETRDVQDGGTTWGLRISKLPAASLPSLPKDKMEDCKKWLKNGHTIEELKGMYTLTEDQVKELCK